AGLAIGAIFGFFIKLDLNGKNIFYRQNMILAVAYLALLLINQLIALLFKSYIPIILFISAIAVGMQVGFNLIVVFKANKMKKLSVGMVLVCCCSMLISTYASMVYAAESLDIAQSDIGLGGVAVGQRLVNNEKAGTKIGDSLVIGRGSWASGTQGSKIFNGGAISYVNTFLVKPGPYSAYQYDTSSCSVNCYYSIQVFSEHKKEDVEKLVYNIANDKKNYGYFVDSIVIDNNKVYRISEVRGAIESITYIAAIHKSLLTFVYSYTSPLLPPISGTMPFIPKQLSLNELDALFAKWSQKAAASSEIKQLLPKEDGNLQQNNKNSNVQQNSNVNETKNKNPFHPQPISDSDANNATAASGILSGIAALLSAFIGLLPKNFVPQVSSPISPREPFKNIPVTSPPQRTIGTRRGDGKIFTKNHGWQNENYPEMNINSIKNVINSLENDIQGHAQNDDKLRTEIARDELKRNLRELKSWQEDNIAVKRAQTFENSNMLQNSAKRRDDYAGQLGTAVKVAGAIGFASDIALAVGTSGVSTALTSAKTTLSSLSLAKEIAGAAADGYVNNKNLSVVITEFGINKGISVGVGKIFDAGKAKYDVENAKNALKALVGAAESSAGNVAQNATQESGFTRKIAGAVDAADNHFKGVAQGLNDIVKGGGGQ
ncbi:MAG: hypothetical protein ACYC4E_00035, partial [Carboxydocellales bacterium]